MEPLPTEPQEAAGKPKWGPDPDFEVLMARRELSGSLRLTPVDMRWVIPGATLTALGLPTILASFLISLLGMGRR